jgi:hypothetical protein
LLLVALLAGARVASSEDGVFLCTSASGSVEILSAASGPDCERMGSGGPADLPVAAPQLSAPLAADAAAVGAAVAANAAMAATIRSATRMPAPELDLQPRTALEARLAEYRQATIDRASQLQADSEQWAGPTPASSRRYLMTNRQAYRQALGIAEP